VEYINYLVWIADGDEALDSEAENQSRSKVLRHEVDERECLTDYWVVKSLDFPRRSEIKKNVE